MIKYLLFCCHPHEASGGLHDLSCEFNTREEFDDKFSLGIYDYFNEFQLFNCATGEKIFFEGVKDNEDEVWKDYEKRWKSELIQWVYNHMQ